jgi:hypothetical protein
VSILAAGLCHAATARVLSVAKPRGPGPVRFNIKVATLAVIQREPDEHTDSAILLRARRRYRGSHAVNLSKILNCFILEASVPMAVH